MTNRWNKMPFLNSNPRFRLTVMFDGFILNGMATKASFRIYLILKLQTTLPCLKMIKIKLTMFYNFLYYIISIFSPNEISEKKPFKPNFSSHKFSICRAYFFTQNVENKTLFLSRIFFQKLTSIWQFLHQNQLYHSILRLPSAY